MQQKENLYKLHAKLDLYNFNHSNFNTHLKELLKFDKKRKQNKTWAYIFSGTAIIFAGISCNLLDKNQPLTDAITAFTVGSSVLSMSASIPFYMGHFRNKKRKCEQLIFINSELDKLLVSN